MGRIEYEYPLFKVYYSNNSNNSNIRGNPAMNCTDLKLIRSPLFGCILLGPCPGPGSGRALFSVGGEVSRVCQQSAPGHLSPCHLLSHWRFYLVHCGRRKVYFLNINFRAFYAHFWQEIYYLRLFFRLLMQFRGL